MWQGGPRAKLDRLGAVAGRLAQRAGTGSAARFVGRTADYTRSSVAIVALSLIWHCEKVEKREWCDILGSSDVTLVEGTRQSEPWRVVRAGVETILMLWEIKSSHSPSMTLW